jgi:hypothetical protein
MESNQQGQEPAKTRLCVKMLDGRHYVYESYRFELLEFWVKVYSDGDCMSFPVLHIKEVVEFRSKFQESLVATASG